MRALDKCALATLGGVLGYAAFQWGGVVRTGRYEYLLALGVLAIVLTLGRSPEAWPPLPPRRIKIRVERLFRAPGPQEVRMTLAPISHHVWTLLVGCRKGGASAPPESRPPPSVGPVPRAVPQPPTARGTGHRNNQEGLVTAGLKPRPSRPLVRNAG